MGFWHQPVMYCGKQLWFWCLPNTLNNWNELPLALERHGPVLSAYVSRFLDYGHAQYHDKIGN